MPRSTTSSPTPSGASSQISQSNSYYAAPLFQRQDSDSATAVTAVGTTANSAAAAAANNIMISSSSSSPQRPWTPPLWLTSGTDQKHAAARTNKSQAAPIFKLVVPPVPTDMYQAVRSHLLQQQQQQQQDSSQQSGSGGTSGPSPQQVLNLVAEQKKIRQYQGKLQQARRQAQNCQVVLRNMERVRHQTRQDIHTQGNAEKQKAWSAVEKKMRDEFDKHAKERKSVWKKQVEEECDLERKRLKEQGEEKRKKEEEERQAKRATADAAEEAGEINQEEQKDKQPDPLESDAIKTQVGKLQAESDNLNEQRTEMIWLLKQVIKAEQKQKAKVEADNKSNKN